jgi:hypothetical protein
LSWYNRSLIVLFLRWRECLFTNFIALNVIASLISFAD